MIDNNIFNKKSIKFYIRNYFQSIKTELENKTVIDIPAGNGATSELLIQFGAKVIPFDFFPEFFMLDKVECKRADVTEKIPVSDNYADILICQEGIEHFSDQLKVFKEFNRVLNNGGKLFITTPSHSCLASKFSYLIFESETSKQMPPNEIDDIWMSDKSITNEIYHGHIFLIGLQKLRTLGKLSGFKVADIKYTRLSKGSLILFPFFYPIIFINSLYVYYKNLNTNKGLSNDEKRKVYKEQLLININPKNLINKHTFIIFEKEKNTVDVDFRNEKMEKKFNEIM